MRSCLPLRPTLNHDSPLVYPGRPRITLLRRIDLRERGPRTAGAEPRDARAAAAARARRAGAAGRRVEHLVGLQAQVPHNPYTALWSRLDGFRPELLSELLERREVVRIGVMRGRFTCSRPTTASLLRPLTQPVFEGQLWRHRDLSPHLRGVDLAPVVEAGRTLLEKSRGRDRAASVLAARFPSSTRQRSRYACQMRLALVQVPPRGLWGRSAQVRWTTAEAWLGRPLAATRRSTPSCSAISPRSGRRRWRTSRRGAGSPDSRRRSSGCARGSCTFRDERGRELFDLPDAPRPDPDTPAPRALPARVRQRPALARRPQPVRLGRGSGAAPAGDGRSAGARCSTTAPCAASGVRSPAARRPPRPAGEARTRGGRRGGAAARPVPRDATCDVRLEARSDR